MKHARFRRGAVALCVLSLTGAACGGSDSDSTTEATAAVEDTSTDSSSPDADLGSDTTDPVTTETGSPVIPPSEGIPSADEFVFTSREGDYTITFPGEPTSTPLPVALPTGQVTAEAFIYEDGTDAAYFTSVFAYEEGTIDADPELVLTGARDGAVTNVNGTLVESEFVEVNGIPGVAFSFTVAGGEGNALVYFDEPRLYQSFALGGVGQTDSFTAFLDTFRFIDAASTTAGDS